MKIPKTTSDAAHAAALDFQHGRGATGGGGPALLGELLARLVAHLAEREARR
jgi:hypothetical protein